METVQRPMTHRQRQVLDFIRDKVSDSHCPPTVREICDHFDIRSTNGVRVILEALEKKGHLKRSPRLSRGLSVVEPESGTPASLPPRREFVDNDVVNRIKTIPEVYSVVPFGGYKRQL